LRVVSKNPSDLPIGTSGKAKNLEKNLTFHGVSNGITHFKIKKFSYARLVSGLMDPLLIEKPIDISFRFVEEIE
jgi:hypothetical protein